MVLSPLILDNLEREYSIHIQWTHMTLRKVNELISQNVTLFLQPKNILKANISFTLKF